MFLYATDVVLFLKPAASDINIVTDILQLFGEASGLRTNIQKSSVVPIQCEPSDIENIQALLPCRLEGFPIKYLGLPLSLKELTRAQLQPLIDKLADQLPGWKADLMTRVGRAVLVQSMLTSSIIYHTMALDIPHWAIKAIDKIRWNFLWQGRKEANGGHCLLTWPKVARPKKLGGLGISDI